MNRRILFIFLFGLASSSFARSNCMDFNSPLLKGQIKEDRMDSGKNEKREAWAAMRGKVAKPLAALSQVLQDPTIIKDPKRVDIKKILLATTFPQEIRYFLDLSFSPFFLVTIKWREEWSHRAMEGTLKDPKKWLVSYEKTAGTSHITRLCGGILLQSVSPKETDVYLYDLLDATHQGPEDLLEGHKGTLKTLRELK